MSESFKSGSARESASLGLKGYNIERRDILRDNTLSFDQKRSALMSSLQKDIDALEERENAGETGLDAEIDNLYFDLDDVQAMHSSEESLQKLYRNKVEFFRSRHGTI